MAETSPAAIVLINSRLECLHSMDPTNAYMQAASDVPCNNILIMMHPALRGRTEEAIANAGVAEGSHMVMDGGYITREGRPQSFIFDIQRIQLETEKLMLISFIEKLAPLELASGSNREPKSQIASYGESHWEPHVVQSSEAALNIAQLTQRQLEVMELILDGQPNKNIASDLRISLRTVEKHRSAILKITKSKSLPALVRLAIAARGTSGP